MLALVEVLLHHCNGALKYIKRLDFTLAGAEGRQLGKKGIRSHGAYALAKVLEISRYIEEVFLPGECVVWCEMCVCCVMCMYGVLSCGMSVKYL
jgi:hypothetical protein